MSGKRAARRSRSEQAVSQFERALRALHRQDHAKARELFDAVIKDFPDEVEVVERARTYLAVCARNRRK